MPHRRRRAHDERAQRDRDRLLPDVPRRVAGPGRARQDHRAVAAQPAGCAGTAAPAAAPSRSTRSAPPASSSPTRRRRSSRSASARQASATTLAQPGLLGASRRRGHGVRRGGAGRVRARRAGAARAPRARGRRPTALELRANGVFVMDTAETSTERGAGPRRARRWSTTRATCWSAGSGSASRCTRCSPTPGSSACSVVEIEQALVDWMRDGTVPHGPACWPTSGSTSSSPTCAGASPRPPRRAYDLVLLDVDNGPGYLVHDDNAALYEPPFLTAGARRCSAPAARSWSGPPTDDAALAEAHGRGVRRRRAPRPTCGCRTATSSTGCTWPAPLTSATGST